MTVRPAPCHPRLHGSDEGQDRSDAGRVICVAGAGSQQGPIRCARPYYHYRPAPQVEVCLVKGGWERCGPVIEC